MSAISKLQMYAKLISI